MKGECIGVALLSMCLAQTAGATDNKDHFCGTPESISNHVLKIIDNGCSTGDYYEKTLSCDHAMLQAYYELSSCGEEGARMQEELILFGVEKMPSN